MKKKQKKVRILSIDGGGMRGIIPAVSLRYIETYLAKKKPGSRLADHFDLIAGTSTGGILAGILLTPDPHQPKRPKYSSEDALNFYMKEGYSIFNASKLSWLQQKFRNIGLPSKSLYDPKRIEELFLQYFGDLKIRELLKPCMITTYNMATKNAYFFTREEDQPEQRSFYLREVLRSTSAAPTYFPPARIRNLAPEPDPKKDPGEMYNLDGGVFANNPLMCAYAEARSQKFPERNVDFPYASDMKILSLGTGGGGFTLGEMSKSNRWGLLSWAKKVPDIMMDGSIDTVSYQMKKIFETLEQEHQDDYLRIDPPNKPAYRDYDSDMTNASPDNLQKLKRAGEKTLELYQEQLDDFLEKMMEEEQSETDNNENDVV